MIDNKYRYNDTRLSYEIYHYMNVFEIYYIAHYNDKILNNVTNQ